jgi:hypothetical protein
LAQRANPLFVSSRTMLTGVMKVHEGFVIHQKRRLSANLCAGGRPAVPVARQ